MNNNKRHKEEHLERLWGMREAGQNSIDILKETVNGLFDPRIVDELLVEGQVELTDDKIELTEKGENNARRVIRAHRIAERLLYDIFGGEFETGACEFEHTVTVELIDGICTLLGHPRECPHGMPIPEGECCRRSAKTAHNVVTSLTELGIGQSARVAYMNCKGDRQLHKLNGLQVRPGAIVKLHQRYPCYVIECEGAHIAMDEEIVSNISVWSNKRQFKPVEKKSVESERKGRHGWGRLIFGRKKQTGF
ncbi:MAG TPA: metal-dependent transcriptional regulator [Deltaproteobacteria bacterium]|nr:metal-dependent transcriptional regulator [Deltaproteobacteria bacterium]